MKLVKMDCGCVCILEEQHEMLFTLSSCDSLVSKKNVWESLKGIGFHEITHMEDPFFQDFKNEMHRATQDSETLAEFRCLLQRIVR